MLPKPIQAFVEDVAERIQCPPDFLAVSMMVVLAGLVGRKIGIRPKRQDDWTVVPNLWGLFIGRPGLLKTPALEESIKFLKRLEIEAKSEFDDAVEQHQASEVVAKARQKVAEGEVKKALKDGGDAHSIASQALASTLDPPTRRRYLVNDTTVEKLGEILNQNPNGVTLAKDELYSFLRTLDKEGHEAARGFYLECWNGTGRHTTDRIGRGTIDVEAAILSIVGTIQPGRIGEYVSAAIKGGSGDDGLIQRFQLAVWPDPTKNWRNVDRWPDADAKNAVWDVVLRLDALDLKSVDAFQDDEGIPFLRFSGPAQLLFDDWRGTLERRLRGDDLHPAFESHLAKYRSLVPSLALLIHLAEDGRGSITKDSLQKAIRWAEYLESHASRIYAVAIRSDIVSARCLVQKIRDRSLNDEFTLRDVYRPNWSGLSEKEEVQEAVDVLIELGWLRVESTRTGGRPTERYRINPKVFLDTPSGGTDKTAESPSDSSVSAKSEPDSDNGNEGNKVWI